MTRSRGRFGRSLLASVVAATTAWIAMWSWQVLAVQAGGFLNPLLLLAILIAGLGATMRWARWPGALVTLAQVVVAGMVASLLLCGSPIPVGDAWVELHTAVSDSLTSAQQYAAPVPPEAPPINALLVLSGLGCLLLVDLLACTLRRAALAGIPLLAIFTIPVSVVGEPVAWWIFVLGAAGYLALLFVQERDHVSRWGRPLATARETGDPIAFGAGSQAVRATAGLIGGTATALAIILPVLVPATGIHVFDVGPGRGGGDDIQIKNPVADLVRDLKRGNDVPLVQVTTNDPNPSYLRILTLTRFTDATWSPGDRDVPADQLAKGTMPPPEGVAAATARREYAYQISALSDFKSHWLPTQPPISQIDADGDWRYDQRTMDFLAGDDDLTTAGLSYTMTAVDLDITSRQLEDAGPATGKVDDMFTELPDDIPDLVSDLAEQVTADATSDYEQAVALQQWFRHDGGFTYSLDRDDGNGADALVQFLTEGPNGRIGYCEQFASAMAVMARSLGIPARVAIGFLAPTEAGRNTWVYSAHDMHAWPELYFDGVGWVRFEPTPAARATDVPDYTIPSAQGPEEETTAPAPQQSSSAVAPNQRPTEGAQSDADQEQAAAGGSDFPWLAAIAVVAVILVVVLLLLLPRLLRGRGRQRRLGSGDPELVWEEVRATVVDLAVPWPADRSPAATRDQLVGFVGAAVGPGMADERPAHGPTAAPDVVAALDRLVLTLELHRYARAGAPLDPVRLRADGELIVAGLIGGAARATRRRAAWWPRSVLRRGVRRRVVPTPVEAKYGGVVDRVG